MESFKQRMLHFPAQLLETILKRRKEKILMQIWHRFYHNQSAKGIMSTNKTSNWQE
jgi:hypothetical protein